MPSVKIGNKYGSWTIVEQPYYMRGRNVNTLRAVCECDCGTKREIYLRNVLRGKSISCGCVPAAASSERLLVHGEASAKSLTPEYVVWKGMLQRCARHSRDKSAKHYEERNITVCDRWKRFDNFLQDMGRRPSAEYQLDRIDNEGDYSPGNVRWTDRKTQNRNKRNNVRVTYKGETKCIAEWAEIVGVPYKVLLKRIRVSKWPIEKAMELPVGGK